MTTKEPDGTNNIRNELLESAKSGDFLAKVYELSHADRNRRDGISKEIAALHNEGIVDVIEAFENLKSHSQNGPDFFIMRHIFETALPYINAPILTVMRCVTRLYHDAGQDMAAGAILDGFIEFCAKDESRTHEALASIKADPNEYSFMLTAVLMAGASVDRQRYLVEATLCANDQNVEIRRQAVFSLSKFCSPEDSSMLNQAFSALEQSCQVETDDQLHGAILKSAFALLQADKSNEQRAVDLIVNSLNKGSEYTLHAASELFGIFTKDLPFALLSVILTALLRVNPNNKGTLDNIDYGVDHLLTIQERSGIEFLEKLLVANPNALSLSVFDSVVLTIAGNQILMGKLATRWFLNGERVLCEGINQVAQKMHGEKVTLTVDTSELVPKNNASIFFVARKAIGYLLMTPHLATSFIVSLMRESTDPELLGALKTLLLDPILLNFPGIAEDYLADEAKKGEGPVKAVISDALKTLNAYFEMLRTIGSIPELQPSQEQREADMRHFGKQIAESFKEAEQRSVFLNIFSKSVLLYGRKAINRVHGPNGQSRRIETPLTCHSTCFDYPRMDYIDPVSLDYVTRRFRVERLKK